MYSLRVTIIYFLTALILSPWLWYMNLNKKIQSQINEIVQGTDVSKLQRAVEAADVRIICIFLLIIAVISLSIINGRYLFDENNEAQSKSLPVYFAISHFAIIILGCMLLICYIVSLISQQLVVEKLLVAENKLLPICTELAEIKKENSILISCVLIYDTALILSLLHGVFFLKRPTMNHFVLTRKGIVILVVQLVVFFVAVFTIMKLI